MVASAPKFVLLLGLAGVCLPSCRGEEAPSGPVRLVDLYKPAPAARAAGTPVATPVEWRFGPPSPAVAATGLPKAGAGAPFWTAGPGVEGLAVRGDRLVGRTGAGIALLGLERPPADTRDVVHEIHVRMRASAGSNLAVVTRGAPRVDLRAEAELLPIIPWPFQSPLVADGEMRTYVLRASAQVPAGARHVLLRPTDAPGAAFEIESVRLVSRREHLAGIGSGLGWQGLGDVSRETLVGRAGEPLGFDVRVPARARLELAVGTVEEAPVTFRVTVKEGTGEARAVLERTVTAAHRWETATVDLARLAGRSVGLSLEIVSEVPRALGFWGTPVIRSALAEPDRAGGRPQGVLLIWADTLRRDHLPLYGYKRPTAPFLTGLAGEGAVFDDAVAQASWTKASGPSILTGLYPSSHTVTSFNDRLPSSALTLAEAYRQAGYATLGLSSIPFVGRFSNLHQGFEEMQEMGSFFGERPPNWSKTARATVDRLLPWLQAHRHDPFFVLLQVADPHSPHRPYPPYDALFADPRRSEEHQRELEAVRPFIANANMRRFGMPTRKELLAAGIDPERYVAHERDWYDGSIRAMDVEMARLFERLREMGLDQRTLVVFLSDHGEEFLEHGSTFHNQSVYGELANVPLFLRWPGGVPAGVRVVDTVQLIDVMPTLLELSGLPLPAGIQGTSLAPLMRGDRTGWPRPAVVEAAGRPDPAVTVAEESFAVILDGWKLVHHPVRPEGRPEFELFDRRKDMLDAHDVAPRHPEVVARLSRELEAWRRLARSGRLKPDSEVAGAVSGEELERLRALGYVQ